MEGKDFPQKKNCNNELSTIVFFHGEFSKNAFIHKSIKMINGEIPVSFKVVTLL